VTDPTRILVVGPSWVGDMVMAQALYRQLKLTEPRCRIDVLAPPWSVAVIARMPEVSDAIELPVGHGEAGLLRRWRVARSLAGRGYDRAIVLPRSLKAALVPWFAGIPVRTGFRGEYRFGLINDMRPFDPQHLNQTVKRFVALAPAHDDVTVPEVSEPRLRVDRDNQARLSAQFGIASDSRVVAMMPGAEYGEAKRWPVERFAALAARLERDGHAVIVLGSGREKPLGEQIAAASVSGRILDLCGSTTLADVVDLLALADVAVTNDSGLMHVAAAVDTHVIAIYGSSSPQFTPPLTAARTVIHLNLECSPCWQRRCPLSHLNCLKGITVDAIHAATLTAAGRDSGMRAGQATGVDAHGDAHER
jgi:heptosyltransferase II